jgi:hypothetical protein
MPAGQKRRIPRATTPGANLVFVNDPVLLVGHVRRRGHRGRGRSGGGRRVVLLLDEMILVKCHLRCRQLTTLGVASSAQQVSRVNHKWGVHHICAISAGHNAVTARSVVKSHPPSLINWPKRSAIARHL